MKKKFRLWLQLQNWGYTKFRCQICFDGFYHEEELHLHTQTEHETMEIQEINPLEILEVECDVVVNEDSPVWWF